MQGSHPKLSLTLCKDGVAPVGWKGGLYAPQESIVEGNIFATGQRTKRYVRGSNDDTAGGVAL